jgi:5-methylthioadenosine/S-adenosylhomocysteine deaminase
MHRAHNRDSGTMPVPTVFQMATESAAKALGLDAYFGTLETGKCADLLLINPNYIAIPSEENLLDLLVFQTNPTDIDSVMVDGKFIMKNKKLLTIDEDSAKEEVRSIQWKMWPANFG